MISKKDLTGDIFGGITAAIVAIPLALAFGLQSGLGAIAGLYGAIALGIFASLFGGTKTQISGPTGPMTVVTAGVVITITEYYGSLDAAMGAILLTFVLAGIIQILMGVVGIGKYIRYVPYPVVSGFMSGIGVIIIILQIFPFFGLESPKKILDILHSLHTIPEKINLQAMLLSLTTIAMIYLFPKVTKKIPPTLVALVVLTIASTILGLNVPIIGHIPEGLPEIRTEIFSSFDFDIVTIILVPAITLAALGAIDSLLTSLVADNLTKTQHDSNKELVGQGIGNAVAGLIGGIPGAGATMRTVVNIKAGGRTQLSGVIHGVVLLIILLGAGEYAKLIPIPVLAGILITVGIGIIDYKGLKHIMHVPKADAAIMIIVLFVTVFVDLLQAVAVGMILAALLFMKNMSDLAESKSFSSLLEDLYHSKVLPDEKEIIEKFGKQVYIQHFEGPIFFGFTSYFKQLIQKLPDVKVVIFRMENVPFIDQSGLYAIEDALLSLQDKGIKVIFTGLQEQPKDLLTKVKLIPSLVKEDDIYENFGEAVKAVSTYLK
ncbi:SulP family inorganic anion transporter [Nitratiruptor sp. SB155-2]|uniref:SulP family inorganic anion transporter n=1 Tax=Nitratiruptor sp. (strain SB155-2) TaxID=387092 RepID=UPI0001586DDC|nr:SulP family inorganic anion transporter [Nitratiruptor sp. SB155-2]BAF69424.1 sulfate transporter [Nitratiruptor sp. SB155-2]